MLDEGKVRDAMLYALLCAADNDDFTRRDLGEIHLLKYLYIADEAYARWNQGRTFTGTDWCFYKFGPWSQPLHAAIVACLTTIGAQLRTFPSRFGDDDCKRWSIQADAAECRRVKDRLPLEVKQAISAAIQTHGNDTASLLEAVYASEPMLRAAPGERLEFRARDRTPREKPHEFVPLMDKLSVSERKRFQERKKELQARIAERLAKQSVPAPPTLPRDEEYAATLEWVDSLAGPHLPSGSEVVFSESIWKSPARNGSPT
jgi:hypothetical protein